MDIERNTERSRPADEATTLNPDLDNAKRFHQPLTGQLG
jgi:hypothetical protein